MPGVKHLIARRSQRCYDAAKRRAGKEVRSMSNPEAMQQLADRFVNDADFREEMRV